MPGALAELFRSAPLSPGKVTCAWNAAVGRGLERVTSVRLDGHDLIVEAASAPWAREVARSAHVILPRLQTLLGRATVTRITVRTRHG